MYWDKIIENWIFYEIFYNLCKIKKLFQASYLEKHSMKKYFIMVFWKALEVSYKKV